MEEGTPKTRRESQMFVAWCQEQRKKNAIIKHENDIKKVQKDEIMKKGGESMKTLINKLIGEILGNMSVDSRRTVENWVRDPDEEVILSGGEKREWIANSMSQAREIGDWLFVFEAIQRTHLVMPMPKDDTAIEERRETLITKLKNVKHESGRFETFIQRFEDQFDICEAAGSEISDVKKRSYFMAGLNKKIFKTVLADWSKTIGRPAFPDSYEALKEEMKTDFSTACSDPERAREIAEVLFARAGKSDGKIEISLEAKESSPESTSNGHSKTDKFDGDCFICGKRGHKYKKCWYFDPKLNLEENKVSAVKKIEAKRAEKKTVGETADKVAGDTKKAKDGKKEKVGKCSEVRCECKVKDAEFNISEAEVMRKAANIKCEPSFIMGVKANEVDFIYDSGTHHGVASEKDQHILYEVIEDPVLLEGVGGHTTLSKQFGDSIFGKTRVLKNRIGSVLVSNYSTRDKFQVINPDPDTFILRPWKKEMGGSEYVFIRDEERYGDPLLHCTLSLKTAKAFAGAEKFYDPPMVPEVTETNHEVIAKVEVAHRRFNHASAAELMRISETDPDATGVLKTDIALWKAARGDFCSGCLEGAMKEHSRSKSTKPLKSELPGEIGAADLMFVEGRAETRMPLYVHVDVASKAIIGVPMKSKSKEACMDAFKTVQALHRV